ncbi:MAG: HDIG domain-containing protein [Anaerolineae bacterium]|nr:HDIG domain-containing protein [Anaerolineae bacterium]
MRVRDLGRYLSLRLFPRRHDRPESPFRRLLRALLLAALVWLSWTITALLYTSPHNVSVVLGEPSPRDIKAPRQLTYVSDVRTQEARAAAARAIGDIYSGPDRSIARQQIQELLGATQRISAIRADDTLGRDQKLTQLQELESLDLAALGDTEVYEKLLDLSESEWQAVITESYRVLDLVLRDEIRSDGLAEARRRVQRLTSHTLSDEQLSIVVLLVQRMIMPNSTYDAEQTLAKRQEARNAVPPVHLTIREGQSILREGEIVTPLALEQVQALGLQKPGIQWYDVLSTALLFLVMLICIGLQILKHDPLLLHRPRREILFALVLIVLGVGARLTLPGRTILPYIFPAAAASMVVALLLDMELAIMVSIAGAVLVGLSTGNSLELGVYTLLGSLMGALLLWRLDQLGLFIRATVYLAMTNVAIILGFRLYSHSYDAVGLFQLVGAATANALLASSSAFVAYTFIGRAFGIATSLQLLELARPNHPLFRQLLINAPGTYHHSIVISNMAERAAEAIGADALLARVGAYYHDIGKIARPYFFVENQADGENPHDKLSPLDSAQIIIAHPQDGLELARKYRIPERVCAFIPEHHGTTMVTYFYRQANQESDEEVREEDFRYPGPKPQSRETAIVMLADGIEAWVRANRPGTVAEMERVIRQVINNRLVGGQLDECDLTLSDLDKIREAFVSVLQGIFHPRIQYPDRVGRPRRQTGSASNATAANNGAPNGTRDVAALRGNGHSSSASR